MLTACSGLRKTEKPLTKAELARQVLDKKHDYHFAAFPGVITTYDLIIKDRALIGGIPRSCVLFPLVLQFPLAFLSRFSLPRMSTLLPSARMGRFVGTLHAILQPFLLRRMKVDVLGSLLPPKKSHILYARLSVRQREAYEAVLSGEVRAWVAGGAGVSAAATSTPKASTSTAAEAEAEDAGMTLRARRCTGKSKDKDAEREAEEEAEERQRTAEEFALKHVNNMKLQNTVMQLHKVCSHPFLFARPDDDSWSPPTPALLAACEAELLGVSGKMLLLDRLLGELFCRGHKVLLFSQFTTMLDIEDWAVDMKGWRICHIDRTTPPLERWDQMDVFQSAGDAPDAPRLVLLSTRSGGLGVNPTAVDTVIFYDRDWRTHKWTRRRRTARTRSGML
ncbi:P-loop containing nucleoside triphosphate hydrolase protein [Mycena olivaceomarginata]|nr:P-loop containing nucleoside triphosphate hydrolase protein [Mycena olivaceomarginata]